MAQMQLTNLASCLNSSGSRTIAIRDFDDTLFDVKRFKIHLLRALLELYGVTASAHESTYSNHRSENAGYDLFDHLIALWAGAGLNLNIEAEIPRLREQIAQYYAESDTPDPLYADARPHLSACHERGEQVVILTTGADAFQRFKIALCNLPDWVTAVVVPMNKGEYLTRQLTVEAGKLMIGPMVVESLTLIDDKPSHLEPIRVWLQHQPATVRSVVQIIWLHRPGVDSSKPRPAVSDSIREINSLAA